MLTAFLQVLDKTVLTTAPIPLYPGSGQIPSRRPYIAARYTTLCSLLPLLIHRNKRCHVAKKWRHVRRFPVTCLRVLSASSHMSQIINVSYCIGRNILRSMCQNLSNQGLTSHRGIPCSGYGAHRGSLKVFTSTAGLPDKEKEPARGSS